jgi:hypothetical protein
MSLIILFGNDVNCVSCMIYEYSGEKAIKLMHDNYNALEIEIMLSVCLSFDGLEMFY